MDLEPDVLFHRVTHGIGHALRHRSDACAKLNNYVNIDIEPVAIKMHIHAAGWFAGDGDMGGDYYGYDGPCPPWNDEILHHYVFTLYALDSARCAVSGMFKGADVLKAIEGHVLAKASLTGIYTLSPKLV